MWKIQLFCDTCQHAQVEAPVDMSANDARRAARDLALTAGWDYTRNIGWTCARCRTEPRLEQGEVGYYVGPIITPDGVPLRGKRARVIERSAATRTVHVLFDDSITGRWAQHAHWFFESEFSREPLEKMLCA